jgi:hypothetical protein
MSEALLDPELADDVAVDVEAEDLVGLLLGVVRVVGELDAARLAAAAGQTCALTTTWPPSSSAAARASAGVGPAALGDGIPKRRKSSLPWYS